MHGLTRKFAACFATALVCGLLCTSGSACGDDGGPPDADTTPDAPPEVGAISLQWQISDGTNMLTCDDVAGLTVRVEATPSIGGFGSVDTFSCDAGMATTRALDVNTYNISVDLSASTDTGTQSLLQNMGDPIRIANDVEVRTGEDTPLEPIVFEVIPQGTLQFQIDTDAMGLNCDVAGAGLTDIRFELLDRAGMCDPTITFEAAAGATQPAGSFANCASAGRCIENDQIITATIPSGNAHTLRVTGLEGVLDCFQSTSQFNVPGNNLAAPPLAPVLVDLMAKGCEL